MGRVVKIAKTELKLMFFSPIAWVLIVFYFILLSSDYYDLIELFLAQSERTGGAALSPITRELLIYDSPFISNVLEHFYFFLPLATMVLFSREIGSGTIKLLFSSPVRISEIVIGKYLAILVFTTALVASFLMVMFAFSISASNPDWGHIFSAMLGLFLVLAAYAAIGLFISCFTSYQIVAAVITLAVYILLANVDKVWQEVEFVRNVSHYLNIRNKAFNFFYGWINLRDSFYFIIIIGFFLSITIIRLRSLSESVSWRLILLRYFIVLVIVSSIGYVTSMPQINLYADLTRDKINTISKYSQATLKRLDKGELEITAYVNLIDDFDALRPSNQLTMRRRIWEKFIRYKPDIKINYIYYYGIDAARPWKNPRITKKNLIEKATQTAKSYKTSLDKFLTLEEVSKLANVKEEGCKTFFQLKYKEKTTNIRLYNGEFWRFPWEGDVTQALNKLMGTNPSITFLTGNSERMILSPQGIADSLGARYSLINQGYDVDTLSINDVSEIPTNMTALVIADPTTAFTNENMQKIFKYVDSGGNLFLAIEKQNEIFVRPLLDKLGVRLKDGVLVQKTEIIGWRNNLVFVNMTDDSKKMMSSLEDNLNDRSRLQDREFKKIAMKGASALEFSKTDYDIRPLLQINSELTWNRLNPIPEDSLLFPLTKQPKDVSGTFTTLVEMSRSLNGKLQKIIVSSDVDFFTPYFFHGERKPEITDHGKANYRFALVCFNHFTGGKFPSYELNLRPINNDKTFRIRLEDLQKQKLVMNWGIPALLLIIGFIIVFYRNQK